MKIDPRRIEVVDDRVAEILRRKTHAERLAIAFGLEGLARRIAGAAVSNQHSDWSEEEIEREVARRWLCEDSG